MATLVDTSALFALLARNDVNHDAARGALADLRDAELLTHNYVIVETTALVGRRLGPAAVRQLHLALLPPLEIAWIDESIHDAAVSALLAAARRGVSLVDWVSFELMRRLGLHAAFAFDRDFAAEGFATIP